MMEIFSDFFGLHLNKAKSTLVGFGLSTSKLAQCAGILGTPIGTLPIWYLGLPLIDRCLRTLDWQPILEKVEARLGGWQARLLSRSGRLVLLKAFLSAIPIYFMSVFRMPVGVRRRLEGRYSSSFGVGQAQQRPEGELSSSGPRCVGLYPKAA